MVCQLPSGDPISVHRARAAYDLFIINVSLAPYNDNAVVHF